MLRVLVVAALVAVTAALDDSGGTDSFAVPRTRISQQCAGYCKDSKKYSLRLGSTYVYNYEGTTVTAVAGASNETSEIRIQAKAHIKVTDSPCELILRIQDVHLYDSGENDLETARRQWNFASAVQEHPLRFSFQDGRIEQLCPTADEPVWALNLKRGLLSAFQNSMSDFNKDAHLFERDVSGTCETTYSVKPMMWSDVRVLRRKNLQSCSGRTQQNLGLPGSLSTKAKSISIIKSEQFCEQKLKSDDGTYLSQASCQETHVFAPFSNGQSGIRTIATVSLDLDSIVAISEPLPIDIFVMKRTNLQFEVSESSVDSSVTEENVPDTLAQLLELSTEGMENLVPQLFNQLITQLSALDDQQLVQLFDKQQERRGRQYLLDALPLIGSSASVRAMAQIYLAEEVNQEEFNSWLTALAFHRQPTLDMLQTLSVFVTEEWYQPKAWLSISSMVHSYCQLDSACAERAEVQSIVGQLEQVLGPSCFSASRYQRERIIVALKAIGNIGFIGSLHTLENCIMDVTNHLEVRLAAVSATRRFSCGRLQRLPMLRLFQRREQDSELRIAAYLATMQCPNTATVSALRDSLYEEDTNQVLSFVWTHLTNLQESTSPWKKEVRQMLQDSYLVNKFKTDARKFSRNYEMSMYSDILSSGALVDSNIVFSTKSYLPRSLNLNLTLDLFGEPVNVFEVGTRLEGFETMVEDLFSSKGYFPDDSVQKMLKNLRNADEEKNDVIQSFSEQFTKDTANEPQGMIFARVFGNELYLTQFAGLGNILDLKKSNRYSFKAIMDSITSLLHNKNVDYTKSFRFINSQLVIPTILGLPLRLEVNGTAALGLSLNTEVDVNNILKTKSGNIALSVNPSVAMQIDGKMTIDAVYTQAGVEMKGSLSSNTLLDIKLVVDKGQVMDFTVNVPRSKYEVINVNSAIYLNSRGRLVEIEGVGDFSEYDLCSGERVPTLSGMRACSQLHMRNASDIADAPHFPLTGKFHYAVALQKSDYFSKYNLHLEKKISSTSKGCYGKFKIEFDTDGFDSTQLNRRLLADVTFDSQNGVVAVDLASPFGSYEFSGKLGLTDADKSLDVKALIDGEEYAAVKVGLLTENTAQTIRYEPSLLIFARPNIKLNMTGRLNIVPGAKYSADISAVGITRTPIALSGDISGGKGRYAGSLSVQAETVDVKISSKIVNTPVVISCKTLVRYAVGSKPVQSVDLTAKLQHHKKGEFTKRHLLVNVQMSELPEYSAKTSWILYRSQSYIDSNIDLTVGKTQWKSQQMYHNNLQEKNKNFQVVLSLESATKQLDYRTELQFKTVDEAIHAHALAQLSDENRFISRLDYEQSLPVHRLELELASPWKRAALNAQVETPVSSDPSWKLINGNMTLNWGTVSNPHWMTASAKYKVAETLLSARHVVEGRLEGEGWQSPLQLAGEWAARADDGLVLSNSQLTVVMDQLVYKVTMGYIKDPSQSKHDLKVGLTVPGNSYSSNLLLVNSEDVKNVTVRLDLEKTLYFTSELKLWRSIDVQLFWNYLRDRSQNVLMQYQTDARSELAVVSMPGHYASLTVDKLGPGFSSMNITAMWGESADSATNAILMSTYWLLEPQMPALTARLQLTTPFIGFQHQSAALTLNTTFSDNQQETLLRNIEVSTKWQDQFINVKFNHLTTLLDPYILQPKSSYISSAEITSSLALVRSGHVKFDLQDTLQISYPTFKTVERNYTVEAAYNNWAFLALHLKDNPSELALSMNLNDKFEKKIIVSGELLVVENYISFKSVLPRNRNISFKSIYNWPNSVSANMTTPFRGYEESAFHYNLAADDDRTELAVAGRVGKDFLLVSGNIDKSEKGFQTALNISSSSKTPDLIVLYEHEQRKNKHESFLKEFGSILLIKEKKVIQSGKVFLSYADEKPSISSRAKSIKTILELPGHFSSSNYSYQTEVKITGVETQHSLLHLWNGDKIEASLSYQGYSYVAGHLKRNDDKKAEFMFKNSGNGNYRTDLVLPGGHFVKHHLFFIDNLNCDHLLSLTSPSRKIVVKMRQSLNAEKTNFMHKTTVMLDKDSAFVDLALNLDPKLSKLESLLFSTTTPWTHPVLAKYNLLIDTGATTKHNVQLKYGQDQEVRGELEMTQSNFNQHLSFAVHSPYCKQLSGEWNVEVNDSFMKCSGRLMMDDSHLSTSVDLVKSFAAPSLSFSFNRSHENIVQLTCSYDITKINKEATITGSYFDQKIDIQGHHSFKDNHIESGFTANTPVSGWKHLSINLDSLISTQYTMFTLKASKEDEFVDISGTGTFQTDLLKTSIAIDHQIAGLIKKISSVFEFSKSQDNGIVSFVYKNNEVTTSEFSVKYVKEAQKINGKESYSFYYRGITAFEGFRDSAFDVKVALYERKHLMMGKLRLNKWEAALKGENTFDTSGIGYLDLKLSAPESKVELYLKHVSEKGDTYSWHLSGNNDFISGSLTISNTTEGLKTQYEIHSSVVEMKDITGVILFGLEGNNLTLEGLSNVNGNNHMIKYKVNSVINDSTATTTHTLSISLPNERFENIDGLLQYKLLAPQDSFRLILGNIFFFKGEISDGQTRHKMHYTRGEDKVSNLTLEVDFPNVLFLSAKTSNLPELLVTAKTSKSLPEFAFKMFMNRTSLNIESDAGKLSIKSHSEDGKLVISTKANDLNADIVIELKDNLNIEFLSNIPGWTEMGILFAPSCIGRHCLNFTLSISKQRNELLYFISESSFSTYKGDLSLSVTLEKFFMNAEMRYDMLSNYSAELKYDVNGRKQYAGGKMSFLSDSARIELATPIKGFEDLTLVGNLNKQDKKAGLVFQNNGKTVEVDLSATVDKKKKSVVVTGSLTNDKEEFTISVGVQNGTVEEPKSASAFISAFKNKNSVFWLSLEGGYNIDKKASIKVSCSSLYYKQLYLEMVSVKNTTKQTLTLNYLFGADVAYMLNTTIEKNIYNPQLTIESQFGPQKHYLDIKYDIKSNLKSASLKFNQNEDTYINALAEIKLSPMLSTVTLKCNCKNLLEANSVSISGMYNFEDKSSIQINSTIDGIKYFELYMDSPSLYQVDFRSSLAPTQLINTMYDISLNYQLVLPEASVQSNVYINGDYYACTANLTWDEQVASTFFQLRTNTGYGFENAVLKARYSRSLQSHFSTLIGFTVDDSILFHIASEASYPDRLSVHMILPDTLFLPFVKEIVVDYNFNEDKKSVILKYLSVSKEKKEYNFALNLQKSLFDMKLDRSFINPEGVYLSDNLKLFYNTYSNLTDFSASLVLENENIFTSSYHKRPPTELEQFGLFFLSDSHHSWNITAAYRGQFQFAGIMTPSSVQLNVQHPGFIPHQLFGLSEFQLNSAIGNSNYFHTSYKITHQTEFHLEFFGDLLNQLEVLARKNHENGNYELAYSMELTATVNNKEISAKRVSTCSGSFANHFVCEQLKQQFKVTGATAKPISLELMVNFKNVEIKGTLSTTTRDLSFGGKAKVDFTKYYCSNLSLFFKSSDKPGNPFAVKYVSDCKENNTNILMSSNIFERKVREISVEIGDEIGDFKAILSKKFKIQGLNILNFDKWSLVNYILEDEIKFIGTIDEDFINIHYHTKRDSKKYYYFTLLTSNKSLKKFEIIHTMNYDISQSHSGNISIESTAPSKWFYVLSFEKDDSLEFTLKSNTDVEINLKIYLLNSKNEVLASVHTGNKYYEGSGTYIREYKTEKFSVSVNGLQYKLNINWETLDKQYKYLMKLDTPSDDYFLNFNLQRNENTVTYFMKYKLFQPLDYASVRFNVGLSNDNQREDHFSIEELGPEYNNKVYNVFYSHLYFTFQVESNHINIEETILDVKYNGDFLNLNLHDSSKNLTINFGRFNNTKSNAYEALIDIKGLNLPNLSELNGQHLYRFYAEKLDRVGFISIHTPITEDFIIKTKLADLTSSKRTSSDDSIKRITELKFGKKTILKLTSHKKDSGVHFGNLHGEWRKDILLNLSYTITPADGKLELKLSNQDETTVDTQLLFSSENINDSYQQLSVDMFVNKFLSIKNIRPKVVVTRTVNKDSAVNYHLNFTNGHHNDALSFSGSCSLSYPEVENLSIKSSPTVYADIYIETFSQKYAAITNFTFEKNKVDASLKWKRTLKDFKYTTEPKFASIAFGGHLQKHLIELYLNEMKFYGQLESSDSKIRLIAHMVNEKNYQNMTFLATVEYQPVFLLSVSHTMFDNPCSAEVRVKWRPQSIESAATIEYNGLKHQAFVNIYSDSNPRYAELLYLDVWQQTHEASVHVEEKEDEVTLTGKINSPALDEHFLVVTIGNQNDKFDLNMNDALIFKVFKDENDGFLDLHIGNDYHLNYRSENEVNISVTSPTIKGIASFSIKELNSDSFVQALFDVGIYNLNIQINNDNIFVVAITKDGNNLFEGLLDIENTNGNFVTEIQCNILENKNSLSLEYYSSPVSLVVALNSPYLNTSNLEILFNLNNEDILSSIFEVKQEVPLFKSHMILNKENQTVDISVEAPLFSEMDSAKVSGQFNIDRAECNIRLTAALTSADTLIAQASTHLIKSEDILSSGLLVKSKLKGLEDISFKVYIPLQISFDRKIHLLVQLPSSKPYELEVLFCLDKNGFVSSALTKWKDFVASTSFKYIVTPFYNSIIELNLQYMETKVQVGAWVEPKEPLTDFIYFVDVNKKRIVEVSHALVIQQNHLKTKFIAETAFKSHEKYGIDIELQNLKVGKIVRLLVSAPHLGRDIGIDFVFTFEGLLNYSLLAQIKIPYNNGIKTARVHSYNKVHPNLNFSKLNHSLECTDMGKIGWELQLQGSTPLVWQGEMAAIESKLNLNNNTYSVKAESFVQSDRIELVLELGTPFERFREGGLQFSGTKELVGSDLVVSLNSNDLININITEDGSHTRQIILLSKWRDVALKYLYNTDGGVATTVYVCWDLLNRDTSHLGLSLRSIKESDKYETAVELVLPSEIVPKLGVKAAFVSVNELFILLQVEVPGLDVECKLASQASYNMIKSGVQLKWAVGNNTAKNIGVFYVVETDEDETKRYFTFQHFALVNDIMLTIYIKNNLYGLNLQYSPLKENELSMEFGTWLVEDDGKERSGVKIVALHPATNTLIYGIANLTSTSDFAEAGLSVSYLSQKENNKVKYVEIYGKRNKKKPEGFVGVSSNGNSLGVGGSVWQKENDFRGVTLEARVNLKDSLKVEMTQDMINPGVEVELSYGLSRSYRVAAGMPNSNELTAKLSHTMYGKPSLDALASVRLNTSKILWGRFEVPPMAHVGQELYNGIVQEYSDVTLVSQAISNGFADFVEEDFSEKAILLLNSISLKKDLLMSETSLEIEAATKGFDAVMRTAQRAYEEDHLYIKTCYQYLKVTGATVYKYMYCAVQVITLLLENLLGPMLSLAARVWEVVQSVLDQWKMLLKEIEFVGESPVDRVREVVSKYQTLRLSVLRHTRNAVVLARQKFNQWGQASVHLLAQAEMSINDLSRSMQRTIQNQLRAVINYKDTVLAGFQVLGNTIEGMIEIVVNGVHRIKEVRESLEWAVKVIDYVNSWFTNIRLEKCLRELETFFDEIIKLITTDVERNFGEYEVYLLRSKALLEGHYEELNKIPQIHNIKTIVNNVYQKIKWFWNYAKLNDRLKEGLKKYVENMKDTLDELENQLDRDEETLSSEYDYNAENNSLTFTQELPFEWRAFNEMPSYINSEGSTSMTFPAKEYSNMVQTMANYLWQDAKLLPHLLPPFGADAIFSKDSFITFDNSFYHFSGDCNSYLLTSDLYRNTFSLIVNYNQQNNRNIVLITKNTKITVESNLEVYINGKLEDLPSKLFDSNHLTIERKVHGVMIKSEYGFSLECSSYQDICQFHLDGWFMGKTAGLLGTYNNEPSDDFVGPNRQPSKNIKQFTDAWAIDSNSCESADDLSISSSEDVSSNESMCELFFSSQSSPFYPCFNVVDPKAFYEMCLAKAKSDSTCSSVLAYLTKCTASGVQLWMPEFCSNPLLADGVLQTGYSDLVEVPTVMSADVVFIVEAAECVSNSQLQFSTLASSLSTELQSKGLQNNRFSLVSFDERDSHIQTINGQIWTDDEGLGLLAKAVSRLNNSTDPNTQYNSALDLAVSLPFRPGASKVAILIHCSSCPHGESYSAVLEHFTQSDITLHVLQQDQLMGRKGKVVSKAIGLEKSGAYPRRRLSKNILPSPQLLQQVSLPQNLCTPVMLGTNGTLFNLEVTRKSVRAWAGRVAAGAVPTTAWGRCENTVGSDNVPVWRCRSASSTNKLKDWDKTALDEYMDTSPGSEFYTEYEEVDQ